MEQEQIVSSSVYHQIPPLSANHQWIVAQNLDAEAENEIEFQIFYNVHDPLHHYRCQIPELMGKQVRGCFYGWLILCDHQRKLIWSLWNPVTSKVINLPRLDSDDDNDYIPFFVLTSPPDDPNSILLMTRARKPHFVFCGLHPKKMELGWTEKSYAQQVKKLKDVDTFLGSLIFFNGKVYAIAIDCLLVLEFSIVVEDTGVAINLLSSFEFPDLPGFGPGGILGAYLVGTCKDIFVVFLDWDITETIRLVRLFKLDMISKTFEELEDLQDATILMNLVDYLRPQFYSLAIGSELGGYIHMLDKNGRDIHSYHVKDKTISLSSLPGLAGTGYVSNWAMLGGGSIARNPSKTHTVTFDDLEGVNEAKAELMEIVSCFQGDSTYANLGAKIPRGVLPVGVPFFIKSSIESVEMFVGRVTSCVRDLFEARKHAPFIIFIDELDAFSLKSGNGFNIEGDQALNQLLTEMDRFESDKVVVIAATMRPEMLDSALLCAGRFSRKLFVKELDNGRKKILVFHLRGAPLEDDKNEVFNMVECERLLEGDHKQEDKKDKIVVSKVKSHEVEFIGTTDKSQLLNLPYDVLEMIIESSVGVEYMNFRASCKLCNLAAPVVHQTASKRLQEYSLVSPWLLVFGEHTITLIDPMSGGKYFIKTPHKSELVGELLIHCSRYGWLLMRKYDGPLFFFNPFTSDTHRLPWALYLDSFDFSAPPTSPNCIVVGFASLLESHVYIHFVGRESSWRIYTLNIPNLYRFPAFYGGDVYALRNGKGVDAFKDFGVGDQNCKQVRVLDEAPISSCTSKAQHFLVKCDHEYKCDQHFILVIVGEFGESVEVYIPNEGAAKWDKIDDIGRHMIYIGDQTCLCMEAKTAKMENKIYFPRLHSGKMVFYSLETRKFHTFDGGNISESFTDFFGTIKHLPPYNAWIEPAWS